MLFTAAGKLWVCTAFTGPFNKTRNNGNYNSEVVTELQNWPL